MLSDLRPRISLSISGNAPSLSPGGDQRWACRILASLSQMKGALKNTSSASGVGNVAWCLASIRTTLCFMLFAFDDPKLLAADAITVHPQSPIPQVSASRHWWIGRLRKRRERNALLPSPTNNLHEEPSKGTLKRLECTGVVVVPENWIPPAFEPTARIDVEGLIGVRNINRDHPRGRKSILLNQASAVDQIIIRHIPVFGLCKAKHGSGPIERFPYSASQSLYEAGKVKPSSPSASSNRSRGAARQGKILTRDDPAIIVPRRSKAEFQSGLT